MSRRLQIVLSISFTYTIIFYTAATFCFFMQISAIGGAFLWVLGPSAALIGAVGLKIFWKQNRPIALGFLGGLVGVFIIGPIVSFAAFWLIMQSAGHWGI